MTLKNINYSSSCLMLSLWYRQKLIYNKQTILIIEVWKLFYFWIFWYQKIENWFCKLWGTEIYVIAHLKHLSIHSISTSRVSESKMCTFHFWNVLKSSLDKTQKAFIWNLKNESNYNTVNFLIIYLLILKWKTSFKCVFLIL